MIRTILDNEKINVCRQKEFDWAKSFAILFMVVIHVYEQISVVDAEVVPTDTFRIVLEFLAGPLGAPMFMFAMGVGIVYSRNNAPAKMAHRGLLLLRNGYLLNFFKGTVPVLVAMALGVTAPQTIIQTLFNVSILQFAAMAFFAIALMKKFNVPLPAMFAISFILSIVGASLANLDFSNSWLQYVLGLLFMTNEITTFPLFLWLYYPLLGIAFAELLCRVRDKRQFYVVLFFLGMIGMAAVSCAYIRMGIDIRTMFMLSGRTYYNQTILHYIFTTFVIMIAMFVYYALSEIVKNAAVNTVVEFLGKNLPTIYVVQWILILYIQGIMTTLEIPWVEEPMIIPVGLLFVAAASGITLLVNKNKAKRK